MGDKRRCPHCLVVEPHKHQFPLSGLPLSDGPSTEFVPKDQDATEALLRQALSEARDEVEQLRVQLAGCGVAAMGYARDASPDQVCKRGDYGWSMSLEDVKLLYEKYLAREQALQALYTLEDRDTYVNEKGRPSSEEWGLAWQKAGEALGRTGQAQQAVDTKVL